MSEIEALLVERAQLLAAGLEDRVAQVDEQLALRGVGPDGKPVKARPQPSGSRRKGGAEER